MADALEDGVFWLPPAFLSDEEKKVGSNGSFGTSSDLGSPVESLMGSTETESDEEDFMAGLTRRMAQSTLQDDFTSIRSVFGSENPKEPRILAASPQSTLCGCKQGSGHGRPNGPSRNSSPPPLPASACWDFLYTATGEDSTTCMKDERTGLYDYNRPLYGVLPNPVSAASHVKCNPSTNDGLYYDHSFSHPRFQATTQLPKRIEMMKQQSHGVWGGQVKGSGQYHHPQLVQNRARKEDYLSNRSPRPMDLSPSAWPPLRQPHDHKQQQKQHRGSGMRAVFINSPGTKRASVGTGVFLPRRAGTPSETRKKPARVMQPINMNLVEMGAQTQLHPRSNGSFVSDSDVTLLLRNNNARLGQQKRSQQPASNPEVWLPQEWTY